VRAAQLDRRALSRGSLARAPEDRHGYIACSLIASPGALVETDNGPDTLWEGGENTMMPAISPLDLFQLALALIVALAYRRFLT
jgi:hypothetical protein